VPSDNKSLGRFDLTGHSAVRRAACRQSKSHSTSTERLLNVSRGLERPARTRIVIKASIGLTEAETSACRDARSPAEKTISSATPLARAQGRCTVHTVEEALKDVGRQGCPERREEDGAT